MKIAGIVVLLHMLILAALLYVHPQKSKPTQRRPVAVNTYVIETKKTKPAPPVKPIAKQKPKPKPKPIAKKQDTNRDKLVQMMQKSLSSLDDNVAANSKLTAPKPIGKLASEALSFEAAYQDQLTTYLQTKLTLPEKGDVKLILTVTRNGNVKSLQVKQSSSESNRNYVQATVPTLLLPSFGNNFKGESAHSFSITLTSS